MKKLKECLGFVRQAIRSLNGLDNSFDQDSQFRLKQVEISLSSRIGDMQHAKDKRDEAEEAEANRLAEQKRLSDENAANDKADADRIEAEKKAGSNPEN